MARVVVENLTKRFGEVTAVDRLNFTAEDREFLVLIGPSGCGKSTTLHLIAGLEEANAGRVLIGERDVTHLHPKDRDIAMVFQSYALYPHMDVYGNMAFGLSMRGYPKTEIDRRIRAAAEILGIGDLLQRKPRELSGGQRQRVAVGRAIVRNRRSSCSMSPFPTWTPNSESRCAPSCQAAPAPEHHDRLRHPRPDRGHDPGEPHRPAQPGGLPADRLAP